MSWFNVRIQNSRLNKLVFQIGALLSLCLLMFSCQNSNLNSLNALEGTGVIGGQTINKQDTESKSVVLILSSNASKNSLGLCTGVLISENTVLTAAHCFLDSDYEKSSFHNNTESDLGLISFSAKPSEKRKVMKVIVHPKFTGEQWIQLGQNFVPRDPYDLAVLRFEGIKPTEATVSKMESIQIDDLTNKKFKIFGYGLTSIREEEILKRDQLLSQGRDAYASNANLLKIEKKVNFDETWEYGFLLDQRGKDGICWGDSGGPAFIEKNEKKLLVGIVSHRTGRYNDLLGQSPVENVSHPCQYYAVLTRVTMFQKWIKENSDLLRTNSCHQLPSFKQRIAKVFRTSAAEVKIKALNSIDYEIQIGAYKKNIHTDQFCRIPTSQGFVPELNPENLKSNNLKNTYRWALQQSQFTRAALQLPKDQSIPVRELVMILTEYRQLQITSSEWSSWPLDVSADNHLIQRGTSAEESWDLFELFAIQDEKVKMKILELIKSGQLKFYFNQYTVNNAAELMTEIYIEDPKTHEMLILTKSGQ